MHAVIRAITRWQVSAGAATGRICLREPPVALCLPRHRLTQVRQVELAALAGERRITLSPRPGGMPEPYARTLQRWRIFRIGAMQALMATITVCTARPS